MNDETYAEALEALNAVIAILDEPDKAIGYAWGLRRGQLGHTIAVRARDELRNLRDELAYYDEQDR